MPDQNERLKPGWRRVKFGAVVQLSKARCANPLAEGIERYVGLEHLEPGDLRIRRWGNVADGVTFTSLFKPGQVLFGKRRAYQRKVAVAEFSGICSGDIYVLESQDATALLPELLPFICQTDAFFDHAVGTSAGSLSPRTNWSSLAGFEFALPPMDEQRRITALLTDSRTLVEEIHLLIERHKSLQKAALHHFFGNQPPFDYRVASLESICERNTVGIATSTTHAYTDHGVPLLRNQNIRFGKIEASDLLYITPEFDKENASKRLRKGDVISVRTGYPGASAVVDDKWVNAQTFTTLISTPMQDLITPHYLCWYINGPAGMRFIESRQGGAAQKNMNATQLRQMPIMLPSLKDQSRVTQVLNEISECEIAVQARLDLEDRRHRRLLNMFVQEAN